MPSKRKSTGGSAGAATSGSSSSASARTKAQSSSAASTTAPRSTDDFVLTLDSDVELEDGEDEGDDDEQVAPSSSRAGKLTGIKKKSAGGAADEPAADLDPEFTFDLGGGAAAGGRRTLSDGIDWDAQDKDQVKGGRAGEVLDVDDIIARRTGRPVLSRKERKVREMSESDEEEEEDDEEEDGGEGASGEEDEAMSVDEEDDDDDDEDGFGQGADSDEEAPVAFDDDQDEDGSDEDDDEMDGGDREDDDEDEDDQAATDSDDDSEHETSAEKARKDAFFAEDSIMPSASGSKPGVAAAAVDPSLPTSFSQMSLSRPLLRALTTLGLDAPTPIQSRAIPLALLGRDVLGSAVTGSGKTAAFMIPVLERLGYRDRSRAGAACRVLVLCPTRELAVQCEAVGKSLAEKAGLGVRFCLLVGGLSLNAQAHALRTLPDVLVATPGRLVDHIRNSPSFTLAALDVLVIDEADRMLEVGFEAELAEIIAACPRNRQTMLFSATMTDSVDELVRLSLDKPVRVFVDAKRSTATGLTQEFVRVRERNAGGAKGGEDRARAACLLALCKRTVKEKCIIFFRSKALAHQMRIVFGLEGLKAAELHGNLTQEQRLSALQQFKAGDVDYLLATDLASRGLDIKGVETVINYDMPGQLSAYTHRVGRTARAGRKGRSITLVGEADRKMLKAAIKQSPSDRVRHRVIPGDVVVACAESLEKLRPEVSEVLKEEKEEKAMRQADMEVRKGQNMIEHEAEIYARPARTWFQSEREKQKAKEAGKAAYINGFPSKREAASAAAEDKRPPIKRGKYEGLSRKQTRRKLAREMDAELGDDRATATSIRHAKKAARPVKITEPLPRKTVDKKRKKTYAPKARVGKGGFDDDASKRSGSREGMRAGRSDGVGLGGKKKGGKGKAVGKKRK